MTDFKTAQEKTILGIVNEIFETGKFDCRTTDKVGKSETVIGELTDYEKAICIARDQIGDKINATHNQFGPKDQNQLKLDKTQRDALNNLLWASIKCRLGTKIFGATDIGYRKDWKLVTFNKTEFYPDCIVISVSELRI